MTTTLLLMDFQNAIAGRPGLEAVLAQAARALAAARAHDVPVVFVRVAFRDGFPEVSVRNKAFAALKREAGAGLLEHAAGTQIAEAVAPRPGEPIVTKRRFGAFASDLATVLSGLGATDLVLAGVATSGVVLTTVRDAADRDFGITVLADACGDADEEVHRVLMEKVFPRQATVSTVEAWIAGL